MLCESTYGDREHEAGDPLQLLGDIVNRVVKRGGSIVIPAFAIGRTQTFMYYLRQLENLQRIPKIPVYVDSPMALSATDLYLKYKEDHDTQFARDEQNGGDPLSVHEFHLARSVEDSKQINNVKTPCIIISASGMVTGGRVLHHLAQPAGRCEELRDPGRIPGRGNAGPRAARGSEDAEPVWEAGAGDGGNRGDGTIFGACGERANCCDG